MSTMYLFFNIMRYSQKYFRIDVVNIVRSKLIEKYKTNSADSLSENRNGHIGKLLTYALFKTGFVKNHT